MVILQVGKEEPVGSETFWNPELTPAAVQGSAKVDWVTEWFLETNWKLTTSPLETLLRLVGLKVNVSLKPTTTFHWFCAWTETAERAATAAATEKRILSSSVIKWRI